MLISLYPYLLVLSKYPLSNNLRLDLRTSIDTIHKVSLQLIRLTVRLTFSYYKAIGDHCPYTNQLGPTIRRHLKYYLETLTIKTTITIGLTISLTKSLTLGVDIQLPL